MNIYKKQKKKRLSKKRLLFFFAITVVMAVLITGLVMLLTVGRELSDSMTEMPFSSDTQYFGMGQHIVYSQDKQLTCIDTSLSVVWRLELFSGDLQYTANDDIIVASGQNVIQTINANGQHLFSKKVEGNIESTRAGKDKVAVYVLQPLEDSTRAYILIFDLSGTDLYQIDVTNRYIIDYGFDAVSNSLYLLELDISGSVPISRISTYRPETQSMTGIKELKDELVGRLYIFGDQIYAVGTNELTLYQSLSENDRSVMVYGWVLTDAYRLEDPRFVFIPAKNSDSIDIIRIIRGSGSEIKINLPPDVFRIIHGSDKIYCFAKQSVFVYTIDGKYVRSYTLPFPISDAERVLGRYTFITQDKTVYLMPLP